MCTEKHELNSITKLHTLDHEGRPKENDTQLVAPTTNEDDILQGTQPDSLATDITVHKCN
jgi:hypothetical protein